jgi:hypothetical protein
MFYIAVVLGQQFDPRLTPLRDFLDGQLQRLGTEAIPALIDAVNLVISHRLGFI